ncbi:MAG: family 10 glycosylhydrolase [Gemmatimonadetes bacterium]|nr:family 10 glycosylhydrolase [Gemmatimonadota bacterium]NNL31339.1 family 10 glycosylhydrolase [Gemmatimonadota bacterium]
MCLVVLGGCTVITVPAEPPGPVAAPPDRPVPADSGDPTPPFETGPTVPVTLDPVRPFDEIRALWVVRFTLTSEEAVMEMVERADAAGFNTLIVQVRGRADAFYASALEPRGESVQEPEPFDPLALVVREAHARGMAVHAWINTHLVWGPTAPPTSAAHLVNTHPDWLALPKALGRELLAVDPFDRSYLDRLVEHAAANEHAVEGIYSSPSHPEVQDRVHAVWLDVARRYDLDGLHFDYIRFPSADYDYSLGALERFRLWVRAALEPDRFAALDAAYARDLYAFVEGESELWDSFRREQVTTLVERIYRDVKALNPRLVVSAAVIADREVAYSDRFQDWVAWLRDGVLDIAVPMAYTPDASRFVDLVETARDAAGDRRRVWAGIGAYMNSPEGTLEMIDIARAENTGGVVLFSYDWVVGEGAGDPSNPLLERIGRARFGR